MGDKLNTELYKRQEARIHELERTVRHLSSSLSSEAHEMRQFRELLDFLPECIYEMDLGCSIVYANKTAFTKFGYTMEDYKLGLNAMQMIAEEDREKAKENLARRVKHEPAEPGEYNALRKDGSTFPAMFRTSVIIDNSRAVGFRGIIIDISERKKAEQDVMESRERFRTLLNATYEAIAVHDKGVVLDANDRYFEIFGYGRNEIIGQYALPMTADQESIEIMREKFEKGDLGPYRINGKRKDGTLFPLEIRGRDLVYEGRKVRIGVMRDLSDIEHANEEIARREQYIQNLSNIVPICSGCKRIRNADGEYEPVEAYIQKETKASLSHGICPDCAENMYPGIYKKGELTGKK